MSFAGDFLPLDLLILCKCFAGMEECQRGQHCCSSIVAFNVLMETLLTHGIHPHMKIHTHFLTKHVQDVNFLKPCFQAILFYLCSFLFVNIFFAFKRFFRQGIELGVLQITLFFFPVRRQWCLINLILSCFLETKLVNHENVFFCGHLVVTMYMPQNNAV